MLIMPFVVPIVAIIAAFTFSSIAKWSDNRRKERDALYRHETYRRLAESSHTASQQVLAMMREEEINRQRQRVEGMKLGGLIALAVGVSGFFALYFMVTGFAAYWISLVVVAVGAVLTIYGFKSSVPPAAETIVSVTPAQRPADHGQG